MTKVLVTACGCPGGPSVIRALKHRMYVIGTDADPHASGRFLADAFYTVPKATDPGYIDAMLNVCERTRPKVLLPESGEEVVPLAENRAEFEALGVTVMASDPAASKIALDKSATYERLNGAVPVPRWALAKNTKELLALVADFGYPTRRVVVKQPHAKGARGFRVVAAGVNRMNLDMRQWPNSQIVTAQELAGCETFPVMVMEYLPGDESSTDTCDYWTAPNGGALYFGFSKIRRMCRSGVHWRHEAKHDPKLMSLARVVIRELGLSYFCNVQFMADANGEPKLLEVNPRISTCIEAPGFNFSLAGVYAAMGEPPKIGCLPDGTRAQYYLDLRSW